MKNLILIIYLTVIFSCTNSNGVIPLTVAKENKQVIQKAKEIENYILLGEIPLPIAKDFKDIDLKLKIEEMDRLILKTIYKDGKIPTSNSELKRTVTYDRNLKKWNFCFDWQVPDGGMEVFIENENSKVIEIKPCGMNFKFEKKIIE